MVIFHFSYSTKEFADELIDALKKSLSNIPGLVMEESTEETQQEGTLIPEVESEAPVVAEDGSETFDINEIINISHDEENQVIFVNIGKSESEETDLFIECAQMMHTETTGYLDTEEVTETTSLEEELEQTEQSIPDLSESDTEVSSDVNETIDQAMETGEVPSPEPAEAEEAKLEDNHIS